MRAVLTHPAQLAEILRGRRKVRKLPQRELANKLGIAQGRYSTLEGDPSSMPLARLLHLVNLLGLELVVQERDEARSESEW